jgi:large subunit ribosomal protein L6
MSRIGRQPIALPQGVSVEIAGERVRVKGPRGELQVHLARGISVRQEGQTLRVERANDEREQRSLHGLSRTLIANAVRGVAEGYAVELLIQGIGYRARLVGRALELTVGFSHPVTVEPPAGITFEVPEPTRILVRGIDKQLVGQVAANLRAIRKPDAYHGKGIRYANEVVRLKPGKAGTTK